MFCICSSKGAALCFHLATLSLQQTALLWPTVSLYHPCAHLNLHLAFSRHRFLSVSGQVGGISLRNRVTSQTGHSCPHSSGYESSSCTKFWDDSFGTLHFHAHKSAWKWHSALKVYSKYWLWLYFLSVRAAQLQLSKLSVKTETDGFKLNKSDGFPSSLAQALVKWLYAWLEFRISNLFTQRWMKKIGVNATFTAPPKPNQKFTATFR